MGMGLGTGPTWDWAQYSMQDWSKYTWWAQHSGKENLVDWLVRTGLYGYIEELSVGDLNQPSQTQIHWNESWRGILEFYMSSEQSWCKETTMDVCVLFCWAEL